MIITADDIRSFADLGTNFVEETGSDSKWRCRFTMKTQSATLEVDKNSGFVDFTLGLDTYRYSNSYGLFASEHFANLRQWASNQVAVLSQEVGGSTIPVKGGFSSDLSSGGAELVDLTGFEERLRSIEDNVLSVVVIDGPAGVGKTTQIKQLSLVRAQNFQKLNCRLILHVESIGRVMQNIDDLIAGALQRIRANITYDQLRVVVRHGLVCIAVDGFDELADPNGYQLAWAQLASLLEDVCGKGLVILAGRETFVSLSRMKAALPTLSKDGSLLFQYQLREVDVSDARRWLIEKGTPPSVFETGSLRDLLTPGSYALRPFFLSTIVENSIIEGLSGESPVDLLSILVESLISREESKFGVDIEQKIGKQRLGEYIRALCEEIARDMADNQSESLPGQSVNWSAEICVPLGVDRDLANTLIHRAVAMPFLTNDRERNAVRFAHRQFLVYFLGCAAIKTVAKGEIPKFVRRNILGSEMLEAFPKSLRASGGKLASEFIGNIATQVDQLTNSDRSRGNLASLAALAACEYYTSNVLRFNHISIDELFLHGEAPPMVFNNCSVSTLHAQRCDASSLEFIGDNYIVSLIADELTRFPPSIPEPAWLQFEHRTVRNVDEIRSRLGKADNLAPALVSEGGKPDLLQKILRYRPFWLREDLENVEPGGRKILEHPLWADMKVELATLGLARIDRRYPASGRPADFIHFRQNEIMRHYFDEM